jgi:hypothetical protein
LLRCFTVPYVFLSVSNNDTHSIRRIDFRKHILIITATNRLLRAERCGGDRAARVRKLHRAHASHSADVRLVGVVVVVVAVVVGVGVFVVVGNVVVVVRRSIIFIQIAC